MIISRCFDLAKPATWYYADLSGFTITILPAQNTAYEYLYIKLGDKNIGKLSGFYHRNYTKVKAEPRTHLSDPGLVEFSYLKGIKEIFG